MYDNSSYDGTLTYMWAKLLANSIGSFCIGVNGEKEIVKIPSRMVLYWII